MTIDFSLVPNATLFLLMLALGMELHLADFTRLLRYRRALLLGIAGQLLLLPLAALLITQTLPLPGAIAVGLMLLAACPGGATSNMFTRYAKGDVALSISLTAVSSMLAPVSVPFIVGLGLYLTLGDTNTIQVSALEMVATLLSTTAAPVLLGMAALHYAPGITRQLRGKLLATATLVLVVLIIGLAVNTARTQGDVGGMFSRSLLAVTLLMLLAAGSTWLGAKLLGLQAVQRRTLALETGIQNVNLALVVALNFLEEGSYLGPTLVYLPIMLCFGAVVIHVARRPDVTPAGGAA